MYDDEGYLEGVVAAARDHVASGRPQHADWTLVSLKRGD